MANIKYQQVKNNIIQIANRESYNFEFIFEFLAAYGIPKTTITRLKNGDTNRVKDISNAVLQKDMVYFRVFPAGTILEEKVHEMNDETICGKYQPRYIIASDLKRLVAIDNKKNVAPLSIDLKDIDNTQSVDFFYGWTGDEIDTAGHSESEMDRKAAENINKIYAEIEKVNIDEFTAHPAEFRHSLNVFFTRLLFCLFAEDTGLFEKDQFTNAIKKYTNPNGEDLDVFLETLFGALDAEDKTAYPEPFDEFPYVDGTIFDTTKHDLIIPRFNSEARHLILGCANSDWGSINPDIFGTIFQGVVDPTHRDESGMDYTSVPNILKVIQPLFLDELREEFDKAFDNKKKLLDLLGRIFKIKVFDPACGSGNFLVIAYKKIRNLENDIWARLLELGAFMQNMRFRSTIKLDHFYGIEIDDFAHEIAVLSMTIAARQCDMVFEKRFGKKIEMLPLVDVPTIKCANSARVDWQEVCPNRPHKVEQKSKKGELAQSVDGIFELMGDNEEPTKTTNDKLEYDEIYVIGNPPYKGADKQTPEQRNDLKTYFTGEDYSGNMDYIGLWFIKGARYISDTNAKLAFVSTNSVCQGEHVSIMFPKIFEENIEINFAYTSFRWTNNAKDQAGVSVIILSLRNIQKSQKFLFTDDIKLTVNNINPYLIEGDNIIIKKRTSPLSNIPNMVMGSMARSKDLILTTDEKNDLENRSINASKFIKKFTGAEEFLKGNIRYCIWVDDSNYTEANRDVELNKIFEKVKETRTASKAPSTKVFANKPYKFAQISYKSTDSIIVPATSSSNRKYIPMGFLDKSTVISNLAFAIYDAELWLFSILESRMHMAWISTVCGRLGTGYRYSNTLGYNTFPICTLLETQKEELKKSAIKILSIREKHTEMNLGQMYNPDNMPEDLKQAHEENDILVDQLYRKKGFIDDEDRLATLFDLYEKMLEKEKSNDKLRK